MLKQQSGFTLIELMIVVAIIGILASLALPSYLSYTARAQASEGPKVSGGLMADIGVYIANNGFITNVETDPAITASAATIDGKYVSGVSVVANGVISIDFDTGLLAGQTMLLTPSITASDQIAQWTCSGLADDRHLPSGCR